MKDKSEIFEIDNGAGWSISLKRVAAHGVARVAGPALIVPGYGMNSFIFGFHPRGHSLEDYFASRGIETWSVDLRGMGRAKNKGGGEDFGLADLVDDVKVAVDAVIEKSKIKHPKVDLIGCSLGATLVFSYLALHPDAPVNCAVNFGGLVTWKKIHPALRIAFASTRVVEKVRLKHTRTIAGLALPLIIKHAPKLLAIYMNTSSTDTTNAATMVQTVEDPNPHVNVDIAHWIKSRELIVRGVNVSRALGEMTYPHMTVLAKDDGIVPAETARALYEGIGSADKQILEVGGADHPMAHADLFLATGVQDLIFQPLSEFLRERKHARK
jgi:alpha-beta hydrolase superfamily lysophospholipase